MSNMVPSSLPQSQSTMLATLWLLLSFAGLTLESYISVTCPNSKQCQRALLSGNDVLLHCNFSGAQWQYFFMQQREDWTPGLSNIGNIEMIPEGSIVIRKPLPSQTGVYHCWNEDNTQAIQYEIDFQDITTLHITHKSLHQKPLQNDTLHEGGRVVIFTRWEPWQDCNRCGKLGERKRLGYCYVQGPLEKEPIPCWLYLGDVVAWSSRMRPELQVEACLVPCKKERVFHVRYVTFDNFNLDDESESAWLTCPLGSIYRAISWEANSMPLTWQDQLSGRNLGSYLDLSTGGRKLQVFQPAIYRCFVQQEFMAQFNPAAPQETETQQRQQTPESWAALYRAGQGNADHVLKGLKLLLLAGGMLALVGVLLRYLRDPLGKRSN
ncbi:protein FAM187B [Tupaia chinensis]|uniref:protein FAM187B n=1 Tax=Tupaia chinensis TaxID=246437 RepID=UPI000FFC36B8|nr:protein FAM187B [Tupaia chinensis]